MSTVRDIIRDSMLAINAIASTEAASSDEQADALRVLNRMIASWSNDSLIIPAATRELLTLTSSKQAYTMGLTGDFNTSRPTEVQFISLVQPTSPPYETPIEIVNARQWNEILVKGTVSSFPTRAFVEYTLPLVTVSFWPVPSANYQVEITSLKPLAQFVTANDVVVLPVGYEEALVYNLAIRLTPMFSKQLDPVVNALAISSKEKIERQNAYEILLDTDPALVNRSNTFNYLTGR
jgi:hypothetical protein